MDYLKPKHRAFIDHYLKNGGNAVQAALDAEVAATYTVAAVAARRLIKNAKVRKELENRIAAGAMCTPGEVVGTLALHLRSDLSDVLSVPFTGDALEWAEELKKRGLGKLLKKLKLRRRWESRGDEKIAVDEIEIETYSAQEAASKLAKIFGLEISPKLHPEDADLANRSLDWLESQAKLLAERYNRPIEQVKKDLESDYVS